ncbi:MAG: hypothetical protein J2O46_02645 [Nocardioides sp.]|nr:hypothetical protein [Nocardioides sp.]
MTTTGPQRVSLMRGQKIMNKVMNRVLATPGVSKGIGRVLMTVHVVGRRTGRRYDVPVAYGVDGDDVVFGTPFAWARNLRTGDTVEVELAGRRVPMTVRAYRDKAGVIAQYELMCRQRKPFAKFNKVGFDDAGNPLAADLEAAWADGARAFRLTPVR